MAIRFALALVAALGCLGDAAGQEPVSGLVGRWQYLQPPDNEGEVLDLTASAGRVRGIMNGLERAGEHGLFYYVVEVMNLAIAPDGLITFEVGERTFFNTRPALSILGGKGDGGGTRDIMRFEGKLEHEELVLRCQDKGGSCPDSVLRFKRISATLEPNQPLHPPTSGGLTAAVVAGERRR